MGGLESGPPRGTPTNVVSKAGNHVKLYRIALFAALIAVLGIALPATVGWSQAEARSKKTRTNKTSSKVKVCKTKNGKRRCKFEKEFQGRGVSRDSLRTTELPKASGDVWLTIPNFREEVKVNIYKPDGSFDEAALAQLDYAFRCRRTNEARAVNPHLYEILSIISDNYGKQRLELVSGFRLAERDSSRHFHASAMDIRIPGTSPRELYDFAQTLDLGGMGIGIYPNSGFVHVDLRAPGEPSYRWTDYSGSGSSSSSKHKKRPGRSAPARKPTS
jgi:uncharacterized protein YcbK (DUF882 family)